MIKGNGERNSDGRGARRERERGAVMEGTEGEQ